MPQRWFNDRKLRCWRNAATSPLVARSGHRRSTQSIPLLTLKSGHCGCDFKRWRDVPSLNYSSRLVHGGRRATKVDFECPRSREADEKPLQSEKFFKFDPSEVDPWKGIMVRNSPGHAPAGAPVFIAQGSRYDGESADHKAVWRGAVRPRGAGELCRTSRRVACFRRTRQCGRRHQVDELPLPGRAGAHGLRIVSFPAHL